MKVTTVLLCIAACALLVSTASAYDGHGHGFGGHGHGGHFGGHGHGFSHGHGRKLMGDDSKMGGETSDRKLLYSGHGGSFGGHGHGGSFGGHSGSFSHSGSHGGHGRRLQSAPAAQQVMMSTEKA
ncbi:hypothetical protein WJX81_007922 [Elliptochloris bilobata]|uniref:Uncharacterized protein n=1 Tax=Elliptochloris bilobata TaxID=381761 RepID=A0AAW1S7E9_9CHLO